MPDSKLISDSVTIFLVAVAFRSDFGTTLDFCLGSSIDRAVMRGSISGLLEEGSSVLKLNMIKVRSDVVRSLIIFMVLR
jgi:hypothetical protein